MKKSTKVAVATKVAKPATAATDHASAAIADLEHVLSHVKSLHVMLDEIEGRVTQAIEELGQVKRKGN